MSSRLKLPALSLFTFTFLILSAGCASEPERPATDSAQYRDAVSAFYVALAAAQTDEQRFALEKLEEVTAAYPQEASAWANLGVITMRQGHFDLSSEHFERALRLAPNDPGIRFLAGFLDSRIGNMEQAIEHYRTASEAAPEIFLSQYALVRELERMDGEANAEEIRRRLAGIHERLPTNQVILYELARVAIREGDRSRAEDWIERLSEAAVDWNEEGIAQYEIVRELLDSGEISELSLEFSFLRNAIEPLSSFQEDLNQVQLPPNELGYLLTEFLWLPDPPIRVAEPDREMRFTETSLEDGFPGSASYVRSVTLLGDRPPLAVYIQSSRLHIGDDVTLPFPGTPSSEVSPHASLVTEIDYNYNFMNDLALAGDRGFRLFRQNEDETFTDVTGDLGLPERIINTSYRAVWAADMDQDGDLDILLAPEEGPVVALRNNGDGTFRPIDLFPETTGAVDFVWADLNGEGTADALFLTSSGDLQLYLNRRGGEFELFQLPVDSEVAALSVADIDANGMFDILAATRDYAIHRLYFRPGSQDWGLDLLLETGFSKNPALPSATTLLTADFDNNGAFDLLLSTPEKTEVWLAESGLRFQLLGQDLPGRVISVFDIDGSERLDLLGLQPGGEPFRLMNVGVKNYGARSIRARASGVEGDRRINSFGIGGEMEVRSGLLYQKQLIHSPIIHFGLGEYQEAEMLRIIWPNGSVQAEFSELGMGTTILNEQLLKGSCPWLFAHDGEQVRFVTDAIWRSPLGLRINAQETAGVVQTYDRVKVSGELLAERNGLYDLRITAELWETHFFDYVNLIAVDHPEGTEVFVDERFVFPAPDLSTRLFRTPRPVKAVFDDKGRDVTHLVRESDGNYLKAFEKTAFQGLVRDHYIEVVIGDDAPADRPISLIASGWLRPTDSSINLALSQGQHGPPQGLRIEVSDGNGGWRVLHEDFGVPAGKLKTILLDLDGVFPDPADRRLRLHTTSEIYWDEIRWAEALPDEMLREQELRPAKQELRFRGYSRWFRSDAVSPKLPDYEVISGTAARWLDLTGYYTRFGDVSELLADIDDRYVIMNAGDELLLEFEAPSQPEQGWKRSFVFVADGWVKDGDYQTEASATVEPLPYHGQSDYEYDRGGTLYDDPVFIRHREDWIHYHTRYITPGPFRQALVFDRY